MRFSWALASVCSGVAALTGVACLSAQTVDLSKHPKPGEDGGIPVEDGATPPPVVDAAVSPPSGDAGTVADAGPTVSQPHAPNGYYVVGATIYDVNNQPHIFRGVDRPSLEWNPLGQSLSLSNGGTTASSSFIASDVGNIALWNANVVRLSLNQDFWLTGAALASATYPAAVQAAVTSAEAAGLDVILDLHWSDQGNLGVTGTGTNGSASSSAQQMMGDANSITFWTQVAGMFQGDGRVLFELYNEPFVTSAANWLSCTPGTGSCGPYVGMQQLYNAVRATGAENLIIVGGIDYAYDLRQVINGMTVAGNNIIYATHPYAQKPEAASSALWDQYFGPLTSIAPVMATEFGDTSNCNGSFDGALITYMASHNMSWSAYAWWTAGSQDCTFPTLLTGSPATPSAAGQAVCLALNPANAAALCTP